MSKEISFTDRVSKIQQELKAPKNQRNTFAKYNYRNQEDILEAVKPLLNGLVLTLGDEIIEVGGRVYVKATATITDGNATLTRSAFAREPEEQKGMSPGQLTGATSSYARKYALNGLFLIDDSKDADTEEFQGKKQDSTPVEVNTLKEATTKAKETGETVKVVKVEVVEDNTKPKETKKSGWGAPKKADRSSAGDLY